MSKLEKLFKSMNLIVKEDNSITKIVNGVKTNIMCNNKPIITYHKNTLVEKNKYILFNTCSRQADCSYLFLEQHMHETLSEKINLIISNLLKFIQNPELFNQIKSKELKQLLLELIENNFIDFDYNKDKTIEKWEKIYEKISENSVQNGLISLKYRYTPILLEDNKIIEEYNKFYQEDPIDFFIYFSSHISVSFPLYEILQEAKDLLFGIQIEKNDIEILKSIYKYIFKNIDKKNAYALSKSFNDLIEGKKTSNSNEKKTYSFIKRNEKTSTVELIVTFNSLATHIDKVLADIVEIDEELIKNKKINLNLNEKEIYQLYKYNYNYLNMSSESIYDFRNELKLNPRIKLMDFNKELNEDFIKSIQKANNQNKIQRKSTYRNISIASTFMQDFQANSNCSINDFINNSNILDSTNESFETIIPRKERKRHTYILAGSGSGKTSLIETFLYADCQKIDQSTIIFDLMGKATNSILKFVTDPSRVLIIDPHWHPTITPVINPFELENRDNELAIENRTKAIISAFDIALEQKEDWSVNQKALLAPCISTLLREGSYSIEDLQRMMNDEVNKDLIKLGKESPIRGHRNFFLNEFNHEKYITTKSAISTRLQVFLNDPTFANLVTGKSTINLEEEINTRGKIIIFKLSSKQKLFSRLIMEMIQDIMRERISVPEGKIVPTHIYLDEFQNYLTPTIEEILSESRNYKFYVTFAHQSFVQLNKKMQGIVLSNSNMKIVGQCSYENGKKMAKEMKADFEKIETLEQGEFMFKIGSNDVFKSKNTDKFIKMPYLSKYKIRHLKHHLKKYYVYKDISFKNDTVEICLSPKYEDF